MRLSIKLEFSKLFKPRIERNPGRIHQALSVLSTRMLF
jgi:hypothetical protein